MYICIEAGKKQIMTLYILLGIIGPWQIVIILVIVLLLFGGKKIPELMKGLGKGIREFKDGVNPKEDKKEKDKDIKKSGEENKK